MKKKLKTDVIVALYHILKDAKCTKMEDDGKIKTWKILRALKPVAEKFEDDMATSGKTLKPEGYDDLLTEAKKLENDEKKAFGEINSREREQEFIRMLTEKYESYAKFQEVHGKYILLCNKALQENAQKEVKVEFDPLSEDQMCKLMSSNDWTLAQAGMLADNICKG